MRLGENKANLNVEAIPTGSMMLDMALGIGGVPRGRIVELYGPESSGKTTVALHIIAEAQKMGGEVAFIDVEHALDPTYAEALGVNIDSLLSVKTIDLMKSKEGQSEEIQNLKQQLAEALIDVVHDFDASWNA